MKSEHNRCAYKAEKLRHKDVIVITEGMVHFYLLLGKTKNLLIDTGLGTSNLKKYVLEICNTPIVVANTHGHYDHVSADGQFEKIYANRKDWKRIQQNANVDETNLVALNSGDVFDLGNRQIEVTEVPGHTPGSLLFFDKKFKCLFCGDYVSDKTVFVDFEDSSLEEYINSMKIILSKKSEVDTLLGCHGQVLQEFKQAEYLKECAELALKREIHPSIECAYDGTNRTKYSFKTASIYGPKDI